MAKSVIDRGVQYSACKGSWIGVLEIDRAWFQGDVQVAFAPELRCNVMILNYCVSTSKSKMSVCV